MSSLEAVLFDLDGTLLDTSGDLGGALNSLLIQRGFEPLSTKDIRPQVSNGAAGLIKLGFGIEKHHSTYKPLRNQFLEYYQSNIATHTKAFDGINTLIEQLGHSKIPWGIVTNKPSLYTEMLLQHITFPHTPNIVVCPEHVGIAKPDPAPLLFACKQLNTIPQNCLYIGDHLRDIECGRNANMPTIAVGYGFTCDETEHLQWHATHNVSHASDIWAIIQDYL